MTDIFSFGAWVRRRRRALDLTQEGLATRVGCAAVTIRKIERDDRRPSRQIAELLADGLAIPAAERAAFVRAANAELSVDRLAEPAANASPPPAPALPQPATALLGREAELTQLRALLHGPVRLVTLSGPGGVGKTHLALAAVQRMADVVFVPLAALREPAQVPEALARALQLPGLDARPTERVVTVLRTRRTLLVLDNFEHVAAAAPLLERLLDEAPGVRLLVTSRSPLGIVGEHELALAPLEPAAAADLFVARVGMVRPGYTLTDTQLPVVRALCALLDGLPLAIELAAARTRMLTPAELLARLRTAPGASLDLSGGTKRTLRETIAWSVALLDADERALFAQLAVFAGSFDLAAVHAVAQLPPGARAVETVTETLVLRSLVTIRAEGEHTRLALLGTIRAAAEELLLGDGAPAVRQRHAVWALALAEQHAARLFGAQQQSALNELDHAHPDLRAALSWALDAAGAPAVGVRLATALWWYWCLRGLLAEGLGWLDRAHAATDDDRLRGQLGYRAAVLAWRRGEYPRAAVLASAARTAATAADDLVAAARAAGVLGCIALVQGDVARAAALAADALPILRAADDEWGCAVGLLICGAAARFDDDALRALALLDEALTQFGAAGDAWGCAMVVGELGLVIELADPLRARGLLEDSLARLRELGDRVGTAHAMYRVARAARQSGATAEVGALLAEQIGLCIDLEDAAGLAYAYHEAALLAAQQGQHRIAAQLFGAADHQRSGSDLVIERGTDAQWRSATRVALGTTLEAALLTAGRALGPATIWSLLTESHT